jgi:hypothetical protein
MRLAAWNTVWVAYSFEPDEGVRGRHLVSRSIDRSRTHSGVGTFERTREHGRVFFALYLFRGVLMFQAGRERWNFNDKNTSFRFERIGRSRRYRFVVETNGRETWSCTYHAPVRALAAVFDMTYDVMDFEQDHMLFHVATRGRDSGKPELAAWTDGAMSSTTND